MYVHDILTWRNDIIVKCEIVYIVNEIYKQIVYITKGKTLWMNALDEGAVG